jgi:glycosyltransferase involved in cell wall biosynthesis
MSYKHLNSIYRVSVIIPSLGGPTLANTVEHLNNGTLVPYEILICIPETHAYKVAHFSYPNVQIIRTNFGGQVKQRAHGFKLAKGSYVLQVDDDLELHHDCLERLIEFVGTQTDVSVSPSLLDKNTLQPSSYMTKPNQSTGLLYKLLMWIVNGNEGYQAGVISKAGVNLAYSSEAKSPYEVEWLPGGCSLHIKANLVLENYYPFSGKAFAEDIWHSAILRNRGVRLFHCPEAVCSLDNSSSQGGGLYSLVKIFLSFSRIMYRFASLTGKNKVRLTAFLMLHHIILIGRKFMHMVKSNS